MISSPLDPNANNKHDSFIQGYSISSFRRQREKNQTGPGLPQNEPRGKTNPRQRLEQACKSGGGCGAHVETKDEALVVNVAPRCKIHLSATCHHTRYQSGHMGVSQGKWVSGISRERERERERERARTFPCQHQLNDSDSNRQF